MPIIFTLSRVLLLCLFACIAARVIALRVKGIKAFLFGGGRKTDFLVAPVLIIYIYLMCAEWLNLPSASIFSRRFVNGAVLGYFGVVICVIAIVIFIGGLVSFGVSFRVGIDENKPGELITTGLFAVTRNPLYLAIMLFFAGEFFIYSSLLALVALALLIATIHGQVLREEAALLKIYGVKFVEYKSGVRRYF